MKTFYSHESPSFRYMWANNQWHPHLIERLPLADFMGPTDEQVKTSWDRNRIFMEACNSHCKWCCCQLLPSSDQVLSAANFQVAHLWSSVVVLVFFPVVSFHSVCVSLSLSASFDLFRSPSSVICSTTVVIAARSNSPAQTASVAGSLNAPEDF